MADHLHRRGLPPTPAPRAWHKAINEDLIFEAYNRLRALEVEAVHETKKTRRAAQQRRQHAQTERPVSERRPSAADYPVASPDEVQPFDEIEELDG